jgi:hypothetical protein
MSHITPQELLLSGYALVTMPTGTKGPKQKNWNCLDQSIRHPASYYFENCNIGLAHAFCRPCPTGAIDVDNEEHAERWLASHGISLDVLVQARDSVVIKSGKKLSLKLLYRLPLGCQPLESKKIVGPDGLSALEFRCATKEGKTVQDVLPPSIHPDGYQYKWTGNGNPLHIPEIPNALLDLWKLLISNGSRVALRHQASPFCTYKPPESPRQIATITDALNYIKADCSYEIWRNVVWAILSTGWLCAEDMALKWSQTAPERFDWDSFWLVANSYIPDLQDRISLGTIYHHARLGGWNV